MSEARFNVIAVGPAGYVPVPISRRRRWWLRLTRRPLPQRPVYPPNTRAMVLDTITADGHKTRVYLPAVRIEPDR